MAHFTARTAHQLKASAVEDWESSRIFVLVALSCGFRCQTSMSITEKASTQPVFGSLKP